MSKRRKGSTKTKQSKQKLPFPDLRIDCYGRSTYIYLDGMELTSGILELSFKTESVAKGEPVLDMKLHPHAVTLRRVGKERIETSNSTSPHSPTRRKS